VILPQDEQAFLCHAWAQLAPDMRPLFEARMIEHLRAPADPGAGDVDRALASMPMRQRGVFASRASTWRRESFWRRTIAPFLSRPTRWNVFLPMSMPIVARRLIVRGMECS
jgi:hypothetical protein